MTRTRFGRSAKTLFAATASALLIVAASALPAQADTLPSADCVTDCTATFDTVGSAFTFAVPAGITELTATIAGAAGAPAPFAITGDPTAVGGAGGVTTVDLGTDYAGTTMTFGVGGVGEGSYLQAAGPVLLVVAGGGGGGGYIGRLDLPDQVFGTFPGGDGGSPVAAGVTPGADATAYGGDAANGGGGTAAAGVGGTGLSNGTSGGPTTTVAPAGSTLAAGGVGGSRLIVATDHVGGSGGSGYTGGGGGAVTTVDGGDDIILDFVAPGGGGSGYLDASLSAVAGTPNTGGGQVSFTWSLPAAAPNPSAPALPATGLAGLGSLPWLMLLVIGAGTIAVAAARRRGHAPRG